MKLSFPKTRDRVLGTTREGQAEHRLSVVAGVPPDVEGEHPAARTGVGSSRAPYDGSREFRRARRLGSTAGETPAATPPNSCQGGRLSCVGQRGSAVLVVLVLLAMVAAIVVANARTLHHLKAELRLIDQEQEKKYEPGARH